MKNYQFGILAGLLALVVVGMVYGKKKKKCSCADHMDDAVVIATPATTE